MDGIRRYKPSLKIYVMWHPNFIEGQMYADEFYTNFAREIQNNIIYRKPGIPVFFKNDIEIPIDLDEALHTTIFVLVDDEMVIDSEWSNFLGGLWNEVGSRTDVKHRLYPVSISKHAFQIENINEVNFIRLHQIDDTEKRIKKLIGSATHEISRLLMNRPRISRENGLSNAPVSLFLSHAKKDGEIHAQAIKHYIHNETPLKTFFDATDIAAGHSFSNEINQSIQLNETALVVLHTDTYSSRDWCRKEVIQAKLTNIPIIVVNLVTLGEGRSFPYMGNVPTIRWDGSEERIQDLIDITLTEILRHIHTKLHLESLTEIYEISDGIHILTQHPELMSFVNIIKEEGDQDTLTVLYPDPPLGYEELQLLNALKPKFKFFTPTMLPILRYAEQEVSNEPLDILKDIKIGLSISDSPDLKNYGLSKTHLEDAFVEFSRYLLVHGGKLLFGGDLRKGGYTEILYNLVRNYFPEDVQSSHKIHNYQAWPLYLNITPETRAELNKLVSFKMVEPPENTQLVRNTFLPPDCKRNRVIWAQSLTKMREEMSNHINIRILMGGAVQNYNGKYPGLLEEAFLALSNEKPLFLIGGFGGCTKAIIDALQGNQPVEFTSDFQMSNISYLEMVQEFNRDENNGEPIDYDKMFSFLKEKGIKSLNNGLSTEENLILFNTPYIPEMISLVLKGLSTIVNN